MGKLKIVLGVFEIKLKMDVKISTSELFCDDVKQTKNRSHHHQLLKQKHHHHLDYYHSKLVSRYLFFRITLSIFQKSSLLPIPKFLQ
jgi:hypothetical protein